MYGGSNESWNFLYIIFIVGIIAIIGTIGTSIYAAVRHFTHPYTKIESHTKVIPVIKTIVITDGIPDTTFIYTFKN